MKDTKNVKDYEKTFFTTLSDPEPAKLTCAELKTPFRLQDLTLYRIDEITFEDESPRQEALENVIGSMKIPGINLIYLILGDSSGVNFYFGAVKNLYQSEDLKLNITEIGEDILESSLRGNFRGSQISKVDNDSLSKIAERVKESACCSVLDGVPGVSKDKEKKSFQGVDRLVDVMLGDEFGMMIIAKPLTTKQEVYSIEKNLYEIYSMLAPFAKHSLQIGSSAGSSDSLNHTHGTGKSDNESYSTSHSTNESRGTSESSGQSSGKTSGRNSTSGDGINSSSNTGKSSTEGISKSRGSSDSNTKATSLSTSTNESVASGKSTNAGQSRSITFEGIHKEAQEWMKYLDEVVIPRLDYGKGKGIFVTSTLLFSKNRNHLIKLENTIKSIYSGESGNKVPLEVRELNPKSPQLLAMKAFQQPLSKKIYSDDDFELRAEIAKSHCYDSDSFFYLGNWISTNELGLLAGVPRKEVVGLRLKEEVEFGLNINSETTDGSIKLGNLVQSGQEKKIPVSIEKKDLDRHIFVAGVTGSGKTTTCQKLLLDSELPFLVIEPAKTEYRILLKKLKDKQGMLIFTIGKDSAAPFRLNPFEFFPGESITSRVDMLKASIEAAFDMEAAIPQIIEAAIYECYKEYGWNISTNENILFDDPFADGVYAFPTLSDLIKKIEEVVKKHGFDERLKNDYIGSIKARLSGLLVGSKGMMLNCRRSVNFEILLERKVVVELEEVRSGSEKSLIIGFILINLLEAIKRKFKLNNNRKFCHITLIEEAHRLLSRYMPGDNPNRKHGVETFADMLAEIRKYGESLIIADQIPNKLTPDVLKNTNTKIVHKLFAQDDKDAIGSTMSLTDAQRNFLSNLEVGRAIVSSGNWPKSVQVQIEKVTDTSEEGIVRDEDLHANIMDFYCENYKSGVIQGAEHFPETPTIERLEGFMRLTTDEKLDEALHYLVNTQRCHNKEKMEPLTQAINNYGEDMIISYLCTKNYGKDYRRRIDSIKKALNCVNSGMAIDNITFNTMLYSEK